MPPLNTTGANPTLSPIIRNMNPTLAPIPAGNPQLTPGTAGWSTPAILNPIPPIAPAYQAPAPAASSTAPSPTSSDPTGGGGASTPTADQVAAQQAAQAEATRLAQGTALFNTQLGVVNSSSSNAASTSSGDLKNSILDYLDSLKANQVGRNNQTVQNYLAKQQGTQGINDMVGQGIRSGGVTLNNGNAGDSSAAGALANAYGQLGRSQLSSVGNQFAQAQNQLEQGHQADVVALGNKLRDLPQQQSDIVNSIVSDAQQKLGAIDQQMAYMSLPDRVNMEAEKQQITNDVLAKLQGFDQILSSGGNQALVPEAQGQSVQRAGQLFTAGQAPDNAFQFSTIPGAQLQGTGASPTELPIFTNPAKKQTA